MIELRDYQSDMADGIRDAFRRHRRVVGVAPTGAGKTMLFAYIVKNAVAKGNRVVIQAHRSNIVDQISGALDKIGIRHGRIEPGHTMTNDMVQVAMVQSLTRRVHKIPPPKLIVTDEAHHATATQYKTILEAWPEARSLGVTATPERPDGRGLDECFDEMVVGPQMSWLIENGFLAKYTYLAPPQQVDLSAIKTRAGDFAVDQLGEAMNKATITGDAISHYRSYLQGRPAIAFCVTVEHAESVAQQFRDAGYKAASVDGTMDRKDQRRLLSSIGAGGLNVLTSCQLIGEGTDIPAVAGVIQLNPSKSIINFLQSVGRALRPKPDGSDAVIIDHVGNVHRHGMPDAHREWSLTPKRKVNDGPGIATCEQCFQAFANPPGWRNDAVCASGMPEGCILEEKETEGGFKAPPAVVDGELQIMTNTPAWAGGMNIAQARGPDFQELLGMADTPEKLKAVAKARGYHHRWVMHQLRIRHDRNRSVAA